MANDFETVMIVDDATMMRKRLEDILEEMEYKIVAKVSTGEEAYMSYKKHKPDFITMDVNMPDMDGVTAVKKIKGEFPDAVIIMISAIKYKRIVFDALKSGAEHYVLKPINYEKLEERIGQVKEILTADSTNERKKRLTEIIEHKEESSN